MKINLYHIHVITASLLEARDLGALREYGSTFATMNMNDKTKELARKLYLVRQETLVNSGGSHAHFESK